MAASTDMRVQPRLMELAHPASLRFSEKPDPKARQSVYQVVQGIHQPAELQARPPPKRPFQATRAVSCGQEPQRCRVQLHPRDDPALATRTHIRLRASWRRPSGVKWGVKNEKTSSWNIDDSRAVKSPPLRSACRFQGTACRGQAILPTSLVQYE